MTFNKIIQYKNQLVFDNTDDNFYEFEIYFPDINLITTKISNTKFHSLYKLEEKIGEENLYKLVGSIDGAKENPNFPKAFSSPNKLPLRGAILNENGKNLVYIISSGEFQPGRYKIYLEGVWELK